MMEVRSSPGILEMALDAWEACPGKHYFLELGLESHGIFNELGEFIGAVIYDKYRPHLIIHPDHRGKWVTRSLLHRLCAIGREKYPFLHLYINKKHVYMQRMMKILGARLETETTTHWIYKYV